MDDSFYQTLLNYSINGLYIVLWKISMIYWLMN